MITRRQLEIATSALTGVFATAVIVSSVEIGSGWTSGGVESGTFPLLAGILIAGGSLANLVYALVEPSAVIVRTRELKHLARLFLPVVAFVAVIPFVGLYVAAAAYLLYALSVQHSLAWWRSGAIAVATVLVLYWLFERTFDVVLPHGWLGNWLGF